VDLFAANKAGLQVVMLDANTPLNILNRLISLTDVDILYGPDDIKSAITIPEASDARTGAYKGADQILFFTSGTTSMAKAVTLTGHSLCQSAYNGGEKLPLREDDILMCMLPLAHVFGFVCGLLWGLSCGASVALGRGPRHYVDDLMYYNPTVLSAVPTLLAFIMKHQLMNPQMRLVLVGAGDCSPDILAAAKLLGLQVSFGYGLTETSSGVAISVGDDPYAMDVCPDNKITLGKDGEILIEAPTCMMRGYYKQQKETQEVLQNGVLHTGDLGSFDEHGKLHITGRKKEILVMKDGTKIYLPEYEEKLRKILNHPDLAVTQRKHKPCLIYYGDEDVNTIWSKLKPMMESYPRSQQIADVIITSKPIPKTATGKIKRWELQQ
jgi:long-subunit acyl-CoA synthetase (AMP-forming)